MRSRYRVLTAAWCALALTLALGAGAARAQALVENTDYKPLVPAQPSPTDKIEVIEFFSYGCPHCAEFFPIVETWLKGLPKDVAFRRVPVGFNRPQWINLERAYYALQASGDLAKLDGPLFHALHQEHLPLFDPQSLSEWVGRSGGNADKFSAAYSSFGVNNQTVQADKLQDDYQVTSIPTMAVGGKYIAQGGSFTEILANTDKAIAQVRKERGPAKK